MKIEDNFLKQKDFDRLQTCMMNLEFDWHYLDSITNLDRDVRDTTGELGGFQFVHNFYRHHRPLSTYYDEWYDMLFKYIIDGSVLDRIKANLLTKTPEIIENKLHTDIEPPKKPLTTSIFYINTNNGYTKFKDGTKVESVEYRLVTFPVNTKHTGTTCTDENVRVVINLLYMNYE